MILLKALLIIFIFALFNPQCFCQYRLHSSVHVKAVKCNMSSELTFENVSCFARSYNRYLSTVNIDITFKKPINDITMEVKVHYKYGAAYREMVRTPKINWCQLMSERQENALIENLMNFIRMNVPDLIHECPYKDMKVNNVSISLGSLEAIFPAGDYKMFFIYSVKSKYAAEVVVISSLAPTRAH